MEICLNPKCQCWAQQLAKGQKTLLNEDTNYNKMTGSFIPDLGEKVKDTYTFAEKTYQCKRKCSNCGHEGTTRHLMGTESPVRELCPNCRTDYFRRA